MKNILINLALFVFIVSACNKGGGGSYTKTAKGLEYIVHTKHDGPKAKLGDFLTLNMQYATDKDSVIFSSYKNNRPLSFKFQETLFKGALNDGLTQMAAGDSATLMVPADTIYGDRLPNFMKKGSKIKYTITMVKVQSQDEYNAEVSAKKKTQDDTDKQLIDDYIAKNNLTMQSTPSGLRYSIEKQGAGNIEEGADVIVKMQYSVKLLDGKEVETSKGNSTEMPLNRQVKGVREGITLLKKGGKGKLIIPSTAAYGDRQRGSVPANSILVYDLQIDDVKVDENAAATQSTVTPANPKQGEGK